MLSLYHVQQKKKLCHILLTHGTLGVRCIFQVQGHWQSHVQLSNGTFFHSQKLIKVEHQLEMFALPSLIELQHLYQRYVVILVSRGAHIELHVQHAIKLVVIC